MAMARKIICSCGAEQTTQLELSRTAWANNLAHFLREHGHQEGHRLFILRPSLAHPDMYLPPQPLRPPSEVSS